MSTSVPVRNALNFADSVSASSGELVRTAAEIIHGCNLDQDFFPNRPIPKFGLEAQGIQIERTREALMKPAMLRIRAAAIIVRTPLGPSRRRYLSFP